MNSDSILLIDDEPQIISAIKRDIRKWIREKEVTVHTVGSADEALTMLKSGEISPAVVICDQRMPGTKGIDFLKRLAILHPETVTIMLTAYPGDLGFPEIVSAGVFSFINKPWGSKELLAEIMKAYQVYSLRTANKRNSVRVQQEMRLAEEFQKSFLKYDIPKNDFYEINISSIICRGSKVTGDYVDIIPLPDDQIVLLLGDVAGHGMNAAFLTAILKSIIFPEFFKGHLDEPFVPSRFLEWLNKRLFKLNLEDQGLFIAFCVCHLDPGKSIVRIANAGQPKAIHLGTPGLRLIDNKNLVLGVKGDMAFSEVEFSVDKGDKLILMTDGYTAKGLGKPLPPQENLHTRIPALKDSPSFHEDLLSTIEKNIEGSLGEDDGTLISVSIKS